MTAPRGSRFEPNLRVAVAFWLSVVGCSGAGADLGPAEEEAPEGPGAPEGGHKLEDGAQPLDSGALPRDPGDGANGLDAGVDPGAPPDVRISIDGRELEPGDNGTLEFGFARFSAPGPRYRIHVQNVGGGTLLLPEPVLSGPWTRLAAPRALRPGEEGDLEIEMNSTPAGDLSGSLEVATSVAGKTSFRIALSGKVGDAPPNGGIVNPYFAMPSWRLWFEDATPVTFTSTNASNQPQSQDYAPTDTASRVFPDPALVPKFPGTFLRGVVLPSQPAAGGFWDDGYATRDRAHTVLPTSWSHSGNSINLANQFVRVTWGSQSPTQQRALGINFTSESYAYHGHQLLSGFNLTSTERDFTFSNTVRGTPSYRSFEETDPDRAADNYDALYGHSYQSLGRSGSELNGLLKMLIAGGHIPRATKNILKTHGAYATTLLMLFKAALPYTKEDGSALPYEHELRHRPLYLSRGDGTTAEFAPNNIAYHQYPEAMHLWQMTELARQFTSPPPVAILTLKSLEVRAPDGSVRVAPTTNDPRLKGIAKTNIRVWGEPGDTLTMRLDLGASYDLANRRLSWNVVPLYPEQKNVTVVREGQTGLFRITVRHDPKLPLGRIPVLIVADNGASKSSPAFVNFFWPQPGHVTLTNQYFHPTKDGGDYVKNPLASVFDNRRPVVTTTAPGGSVSVNKGQTAAFDVTCTDPEGFQTALYRHAGEVGTLAGGHFSWATTPADAAATRSVHILCSDGTGAFGSATVQVVVK